MLGEKPNDRRKKRTNDTHMKTSILSTIATVVAALTFTSAAYAQYKPVGDDGIAASPKVRQMLNERPASVTTTAAAPAMACPKCADVRIAKVSPQAKGAEIMTSTKQVTYSHACTSCETKLAVAGVGKAKHQVATHSCSMNVASNPNCCASK
jgi:hypothetical protein